MPQFVKRTANRKGTYTCRQTSVRPRVVSDDIRRYPVLYLVPIVQVHPKVKQVAQRSSEEVFVEKCATDDVRNGKHLVVQIPVGLD